MYTVNKVKQHWTVEKNAERWPQSRVVLDGQNDVYIPVDLPLRGRTVACKLLPTTVMKREDMPESLLAWLQRDQADQEAFAG